uniref:Coiled-coil domain-containing protein 167 n=1 Tax=Strongyloides venezuelensis TaxID=75913 RepID=A0A0K0G3P6_STRVS
MKLADGTEINSVDTKKARASMISDMARRQREHEKTQGLSKAQWEYRKKLLTSIGVSVSVVSIAIAIQYYLNR